MIYFNCDYNEGAHPEILARLSATNMEQTIGYGCDEYCEEARALIRKECQASDADVHFLVGGTQANATIILAALRSYQGALCAQSGHINVHETGAVELDGHKVLGLPSADGKITAQQIDAAYQAHIHDSSFEHTVQPKLVYISQPTELGTLYTRAELEAISKACRADGLYLFVDGARLGYGMAADSNDVFLPDLAQLADVFYIGGTKLGALFGEAVVITNADLKKDFRYLIKQKGAMLAKGRLLGLQFSTLLDEAYVEEVSLLDIEKGAKNLYMKGGYHAIRQANQIRESLNRKEIPYLVANDTNQIFPVLPDEAIQKLSDKYCLSYQERVDETHSAVRICTSWATKQEDVDALCEDLRRLDI